jgi:hypothetical protein
MILALSHHIETLKETLAKAEAATERERERAERLERDLGAARRDLEEERTRRVVAEVEAAVAPALRVTVEALKGALETEKGRVGGAAGGAGSAQCPPLLVAIQEGRLLMMMMRITPITS